MTNHLGNIMATVTDRKDPVVTATGCGLCDVSYYKAVLVSASDYYPFGTEMVGRKMNTGTYRFGFNGKEKDPKGEWGTQTHYDYGFRIYNPAVGRFLSVDPLRKKYPMLTPYQFASNSPIYAIDLDGLEAYTVYARPTEPDAVFVLLTSLETKSGGLEVYDERTGKTSYGTFPEKLMQAQLGGTKVNDQGDLYTQGDPDYSSEYPNLASYAEPPFNASELVGLPTRLYKFPISESILNYKNHTTKFSVSGDFASAGDEIVVKVPMPTADNISTDFRVTLNFNDGGQVRNNFSIFANGEKLKEFSRIGEGVFSIPKGTNEIEVRIQGESGNEFDIYRLEFNINFKTSDDE